LKFHQVYIHHYGATYDISLRDIEERSLKIQMMLAFQRNASWVEKMIKIEKRPIGPMALMCELLIASNVPMERLKYSSLLELPTICPYGTFEMIDALLNRFVAAQECDARKVK